MNITALKVGDMVELQPTNQRNRQLRKQYDKWEWVIIKIDPETICFNKQEGILIQSVIDRKHDRWVQREDIKLVEYRENQRDV
jgi:hypothetical protein